MYQFHKRKPDKELSGLLNKAKEVHLTGRGAAARFANTCDVPESKLMQILGTLCENYPTLESLRKDQIQSTEVTGLLNAPQQLNDLV